MNQYDVFQLDHLKVVVLQHPFVQTPTVVVAPLLTTEQVVRPLTGLMPAVGLNGTTMVIDIPALAAIKRALLRQCIANLEKDRLTIVSAMDLLFSGF